MLLTLDTKHLDPHQVTSVLGQIMPNNLALNPTVNYRMSSLTTIVLYPQGGPNIQKITTYLYAKGTSKKTCFLFEQLIQSKTPDFTRGRLYDRVKLFSFQRKTGDFHKDFYIQ